jgi:hypothetical protein
VAVELSILVATVLSLREGLLSRLLNAIEPQLDDLRVECIVHRSEDKSMGRKFNELYRAANGRLAVQVDDDDLIYEEYVDEVLAVSEGHDFVGYKVDVTVDGWIENMVTYEIDPRRVKTLRPYSARDIVRHVTPKCPILTSEARKHQFGSYYGVDWHWTRDLIRDGYPHNPVFIDKSLYLYDCWTDHSLGTKPEEWTEQRQVPVLPYDRHRFTWIE